MGGDKVRENVKLHFTQTLTDDAKFSCFISNSDGSNIKASTEITLDVIEVSLPNKEVREGAQAKLTCTVTKLSADATFTWKDKDDNDVTPTGTPPARVGSSQSSILTVEAKPDPTYKCIVSS